MAVTCMHATALGSQLSVLNLTLRINSVSINGNSQPLLAPSLWTRVKIMATEEGTSYSPCCKYFALWILKSYIPHSG